MAKDDYILLFPRDGPVFSTRRMAALVLWVNNYNHNSVNVSDAAPSKGKKKVLNQHVLVSMTGSKFYSQSNIHTNRRKTPNSPHTSPYTPASGATLLKSPKPKFSLKASRERQLLVYEGG